MSFRTNGGAFHASADIPADATVVTCPFSLAITPQVAKKSLVKLLNGEKALEGWSKRQLLCVYLCFHGIIQLIQYDLTHKPYLDTLPSQDSLTTALHFTKGKLDQFRGSNLYGATDAVAEMNKEWGKAVTCDAYLTTSTYLSSRTFPCTVISSTPTLQSTPDFHPISRESISIVPHRTARSGEELVNNYGVKPNSELILGYGFSLPFNLEDTIRKWEVGRGARGAEEVWGVVLEKVKGASQGQNGRQDKENKEIKPPGDEKEDAMPAYKDKREAAQMLADMVETLLDRLPADKAGAKRAAAMRPEIAQMLHDYIAGQRDILESLLKFAMQKETGVVEEAREAGVELVFE
ncbi:hypothetical protein BDV98DRAFT_610907 [Pterulicium gracile]|uniref:SET domain-containing protein n=1 Tax=Pterulicium gracile TaxID=1884261 RepID=A0A5C3QVQ9_9AGAR|nr:hypothetical protein BDV98DRAFT_610907 [Pterula gracilis]